MVGVTWNTCAVRCIRSPSGPAAPRAASSKAQAEGSEGSRPREATCHTEILLPGNSRRRLCEGLEWRSRSFEARTELEPVGHDLRAPRAALGGIAMIATSRPFQVARQENSRGAKSLHVVLRAHHHSVLPLSLLKRGSWIIETCSSSLA